MTHRNRMLATGDLVADPARGLFMGNRGILHDERGHIGRALWKHKSWIICVLEHKGWHRTVMTPGAYTELFFLDDAVALAAGHRPCALCRRSAFDAYRRAAGLTSRASDMDDRLHTERAIPRTFGQRRYQTDAATLPDGAIILDTIPLLVQGDRLRPVSPSGYGDPRPRMTGIVTVLTPPTSVAALKGGFSPVLHPSA
ncbi:hypothetical protein EF888_08605 [Silicimonas algicola]|nr:hypothetical protein [Silicimonas algicola]AZQ67188.1 hypothetical protein EF888_08605 [Silicimonas algicola]